MALNITPTASLNSSVQGSDPLVGTQGAKDPLLSAMQPKEPGDKERGPDDFAGLLLLVSSVLDERVTESPATVGGEEGGQLPEERTTRSGPGELPASSAAGVFPEDLLGRGLSMAPDDDASVLRFGLNASNQGGQGKTPSGSAGDAFSLSPAVLGSSSSSTVPGRATHQVDSASLQAIGEELHTALGKDEQLLAGPQESKINLPGDAGYAEPADNVADQHRTNVTDDVAKPTPVTADPAGTSTAINATLGSPGPIRDGRPITSPRNAYQTDEGETDQTEAVAEPGGDRSAPSDAVGRSGRIRGEQRDSVMRPATASGPTAMGGNDQAKSAEQLLMPQGEHRPKGTRDSGGTAALAGVSMARASVPGATLSHTGVGASAILAADAVVRAVLSDATHEQSGLRRIEVELTPPELGRVLVELSETRRGVAARIVADSSQTAALLESQLAHMKQMLQESGVSVSQFDVFQQGEAGAGGDGNRNARQQAARLPTDRVSSSETARRPTSTIKSMASPHRVDIQV